MTPTRRHPVHPGEVLKEEFMAPLSLTPQQLAAKLGGHWTELHITAIIEGKEGINQETANAFAKFFGAPSEFWIRLDQQYYQWEQTHHRNKGKHELKKAQ